MGRQKLMSRKCLRPLGSTLLTDRYPTTAWPGGAAGHQMSLNRWFLYGTFATNVVGGNYCQVLDGANYSGAYGTPPDLGGVGAIGIDWGGRPLYCFMGQNINDSSSQQNLCPYEFNLASAKNRGSTTTPGNLPFGVAELERLLRPDDKDAPSLPNRLATIVGTPSALTAHRHNDRQLGCADGRGRFVRRFATRSQQSRNVPAD